MATELIISYVCGALFVLSLFFKRGRKFWGDVLYFMTTLEARTVRDKMYLNLYREYIRDGKPIITRKQFIKVVHIHDVSYYRSCATSGVGLGSDFEKYYAEIQPFFDPEYFEANYISPEDLRGNIDKYDAYRKETDPELDDIRGKLKVIHEKIMICIPAGIDFSELDVEEATLRDRQTEIFANRAKLIR